MSNLSSDGSPLFPSIDEGSFEALRAHLQRLAESLPAHFCLLSNLSGLLLLTAGEVDPRQATSFASLLAANISAVKQIALLIGEDAGFEKNFFEGKTHNLYVHELENDYILTIVFSRQTTFGLVRSLSQRYAPIFTELLEQSGSDKPSVIPNRSPGDSFSTELTSRLDSLFKLEE
ncbi:MAG: roadblock/LC7 domain-containing protein [bacterium]|nr:roadblock/LC7 domain-containing protein [bacterium]